MSITKYVLGLMFSPDGSKLVLVRKNRPSFLAGRLNAIGGHHEEGETAVEAVRREFEEETGISTTVEDWTLFTTLNGACFTLPCFFAHSDRYVEARTATDEPVAVYAVDALDQELLAPDLRYLIELVADLRMVGT